MDKMGHYVYGSRKSHFRILKVPNFAKVQRIKSAEPEKAQKRTRQNQTTAIFFVIEQTLSLNDSL